MSRVLREPLVHFLILGALLFLLYSSLNRGFDAPDEIVVSGGQIDSLEDQFTKVWQREPTEQELDGLIENWVREEVLYREGQKMGLDQNDQVIRRRVMQKIEFIAEGASPQNPSDPELQAWLEAHPDDYRIEPRYSFTQIYFDPSRHAGTLEADVLEARAALVSGKAMEGDRTLLPSTMENKPASEIERVFGNRFSDSLETQETGQWSEPIASGFGVHLVYLDSLEPARAATLDEARKAVERDLLHERTTQAKQTFYESLKENYTIRIEDRKATAVPASAAP